MPSTTVDRIYGISTSVAVKAPVRAATTGNISLSGLQTVDGVVLASGDRVLAWQQTNPVDNGIWVVSTGSWTRDGDFDGFADVVTGTTVQAIEGDTQQYKWFNVTTPSPVSIGVDNITFSRVYTSLNVVEQATESVPGITEIATQSETNAGTNDTDFVTPLKLTTNRKTIGYINAKDFGAVGDSTTDDSTALQSAIDYCRDNFMSLYIPPAGGSGGTRKYYKCNTSLKFYDNSHIFGGGNMSTELRFPNDTNGFEPSDDTVLTTNVVLHDMFIRGNADVSLVSTVTKGLRLKHTTYSHFYNLWIQDFVDQREQDAGTLGFILNRFNNVKTIAIKYPNATNGYPRYLSSYTGSVAPQANEEKDCIWYGQISTKSQDYSGDSSNKSFTLALNAGTKLWAETGIKVYVVDTNGIYQKQTITTDYTLKDQAAVAIAAGSTGSQATSIVVTFVTAPASGTNNVRIIWSDPTASRCISVAAGTGNKFHGSLGGASTGCYFNDEDNTIDYDYMQLCDIGVQFTASANRCIRNPGRHSNQTIDAKVSLNSSVLGVQLFPGLAAQANAVEITSDTGALTSATAALITGLTIAHPCTRDALREITAEMDVLFTKAAGSRVTVAFTIDKSVNAGTTWATLLSRTVDINLGGATSINLQIPVILSVIDTQRLNVAAGATRNVNYRVTYAITNGDSINVKGTTNSASFLRIKDINPL